MDITLIRWLALAVLLVFSAYSFYCLAKENFWRACKGVWAFHWGRQVTADLFVGIFLFIFFIYMNEGGSVGATLLWAIPILVLGNPVALLYFVLNFDSIVRHFLS